MHFLVLNCLVIINHIMRGGLCDVSNSATYNHVGKRELQLGAHATLPFYGNQFQRDYYNFYRQQPQQSQQSQQQQQQQQQQHQQQQQQIMQNTIEDPGFNRQDDHDFGLFTKALSENALTQFGKLPNSTNVHNFLEFNNPPGQMFHLIYMPMNGGAQSSNQNQNNVLPNLSYTGPQIFPNNFNGQTANGNRNNLGQSQTPTQTQPQVQTPAPASVVAQTQSQPQSQSYAHTQLFAAAPSQQQSQQQKQQQLPQQQQLTQSSSNAYTSQFLQRPLTQSTQHNLQLPYNPAHHGFMPSPYPVVPLYPTHHNQRQTNSIGSKTPTRMEAPFVPSQFLGAIGNAQNAQTMAYPAHGGLAQSYYNFARNNIRY